jgi:hypothetical protein
MSEKNGKCPMCPRGCDLSAPSCGRGRAYAESGSTQQTSENVSAEHGHEHHQGHGHEHHHGYGYGHHYGHGCHHNNYHKEQ